MTLATPRTPPLRRRFPLWGASPWEGSRPLPPAPCTSVPCWRRSAAISTRARMAHAGWCASRISIRRAWFQVVPTTMLRTLEAFGFEWDGEVLFQSTRRAAYADAIATLTKAGRIFACSCSRKDLAGVDEEAQGYPGTCRSGPTKAGAHRAALPRARTAYPLRRSVPRAPALRSRAVWRRGRAATRRHRELPARGGGRRCLPGCDASGAWRRPAEQHPVANRSAGCARAAAPIYGHLPLLLEPDGTKLSKSRNATPIDPAAGAQTAYFDPYAFVADPTPRPGRLLY